MLKLYPSSSGFAWGNLAITEYDSGCLRAIVFKGLSPHRTEIDPKYMRVGAHHEDAHAAALEQQGIPFEREIVMKEEVLPGVQLSGRCDFLLEREIHETKGSLSKSAGYVLKGKFKVGHLSQLVTYMLHWDKPIGRIVFAAYKEAGDAFKETGRRTFTITLGHGGGVLVDDLNTPYFVQDLLAHRNTAAVLLSERRVHPERPLNHDAKFGSPCAYCPFKTVCDKYDAGALTDEQAITQADEVISGKHVNEA